MSHKQEKRILRYKNKFGLQNIWDEAQYAHKCTCNIRSTSRFELTPLRYPHAPDMSPEGVGVTVGGAQVMAGTVWCARSSRMELRHVKRRRYPVACAAVRLSKWAISLQIWPLFLPSLVAQPIIGGFSPTLGGTRALPKRYKVTPLLPSQQCGRPRWGDPLRRLWVSANQRALCHLHTNSASVTVTSPPADEIER